MKRHFLLISTILFFLGFVLPISVSATTIKTFDSNLGLGARGVVVERLQQALKDLGVYSGPVTGYFGPLTKKAVIEFQKKNDIFPPYGFVGPLTRAKLNESQSSPGWPTSSITPECTSAGSANLDDCWQTRAVTEKNAAFCNNIKGDNPFVSKDACLNLVAKEKNDKTICSLIKNIYIKQNCEETVK